jgi:hypothetical protein
MKKICILTAVLTLLTLSLNAQMQAKKNMAQQSASIEKKVDIKLDGIQKAASKLAINRAPSRADRATTYTLDLFDTTSYVAQVLPVYGYWYDAAQHNQMIYPASMLTDMAGKKIKSMTFYPASYSSYSGINFYSGSVTFKLMEVNGSTGFNSSSPSLISGNMTTVATVTPTKNVNATTWLIEFDDEYDYNGGDLVIDVTSTAGTYGYTYFYIGTTTSLGVAYPGYLSYNSNTSAINYVPAVLFTYEDTTPQHDLAIALNAQPTSVAAGGTVTLTATVTNNGDFAENGYTVTFTANGTTIDTQAGTSLAVGASTTFTYTYTTTDAQGGTTVNFGANVACTGDINAANDDATASTSVLACPPPVNVQATASDQSGTMTWDAPNISSTTSTYTWDFETSSQANEWTLVNADGDSYNWNYNTYVEGTSASIFEPHSGTGYMVSASYVNNVGALTPDNWMISPEVALGGTLTLWAKGTDTNDYQEVFGVFVYEGSYSSGTSGFVQVDANKTTTNGWVQYTFDLSQYSGAGRFAIRHYNCTNMYNLEVDDINYQVTVPGEQPTSYNVYLEGQLVGNVPSTDALTYTFNNLSDGTYNCSVSAVYSYGESVAVPATFTIAPTSTIEISPATQTISDAAAGALTVTGTNITGNINVSVDNDWSLNPTSLSSNGGNVSVSYTGRALSATTTVTATAVNDNTVTASATVNYVADVYIVGDFGTGTGWDFNNGTQMSYSNGTYTATITVNNTNTYILFARLLGNSDPWNTRDVFGPSSSGNWWMDADQKNGNIDVNASNCIYFPTVGTYRITINSDGTFTIIKLNGEQTAPPVITSTVSADGEYVTITATGDGTVTLNVPGYDPVIGENGEASITIPCGPVSNTITVTATAQETGKDESDPASAQVTIPAGSDWLEMDGTYNPTDLLSFLKDGEDIAMVDQFLASTLENKQLDHYTYTLRQTVNGETQTSTPVDIPVYKTNSTMQGLYTKTQVDNDLDKTLAANVINTEMDYDVNPDRNVLYYSLYRGDVNDVYPEITVDSRISQLQKFEEMVGEYPQYYLFESHPENILPRYEQADHIGSQMVERLDLDYVEADPGDTLSYVPVIWTYGLYTARGDGKNNSYGSDIKREKLGAVTATYGGQLSTDPYGTFTVGTTKYCICHPVIHITGVPPVTRVSKDGDISTYVPYMYRAWSDTEGMHDFNLVSGQGFEDAGAITAPKYLDTKVIDATETVLGGEWSQGMPKLPWAFAIPVGTTPHFIVRFYYKKIVTEGQSNGTMLTLGNGEGEEYFIAEGEGDGNDMVTGIAEMTVGAEPIEVIYVNSLGMQSDQPFDGVNIVVTRYSDGTTVTKKVIR